MADLQLGAIEARFADMIWAKAPISTTDLIRLCEETFSWKRTTTYTVLKRLCGQGIFELENSTVRTLISREEFYARQSRHYVDTTFGGSLPAFLAAFTEGRKLTVQEAAKLKAMIEQAEEDEP